MKKGFTLAEVLVTLGIIGVVAALTIPALNANVAAQKIGPALSKAVNTLENANRRALVETESTAFSGSDYLANISTYVNGNLYTPSNAYPVKQYNGTTAVTIDKKVMLTKDGIGYYTNGTGTISSVSDTEKYSGTYYNVYVDINGPEAAPNSLGKDVFRFAVDTAGSVIPYGGLMWKDYGGASTILWNASSATRCKGSTVDTGNECAGAVADNGWKAAYK